jgi:IS30 family transposase
LKYQQLSQEERYTIVALLKTHISLSAIAREIGRSPSTVSRELRRNLRPVYDRYSPDVAHSYAIARRKRSRRGSNFTKEQWDLVLFLLRHKFSPEQISNTLKRFNLFSISHETIYQYLLYDKKHGGVWHKHLRAVSKRRRKRYNSYDSRGRLAGKRSISDRPEVINKRLEIGHWEGDTVVGRDRHHCIVTLVERKTGFVIIKKITARNVEQVNKACAKAIKEHGRRFKTITFDNGTEFHGYKTLEEHYPVTCYFAAPYHSWERGTNENTNGLIRQYIPKGSCMKNISQYDCDRIAYALNTRPRKRHCYKTPEELYYGKDSALHLLLEPKYEIIGKINLHNIDNSNEFTTGDHDGMAIVLREK